MQPNSDLIDLLLALNAAGAKYLIVGGYAFAYHGRIRATKDADVFVGSDPENAARVWCALVAFGAPLSELRRKDLRSKGTFFIMGRAPNQIDIITEIDGVSFEEAWDRRIAATIANVPVAYLSRNDLIANKTAAGRPQDLADLAYLQSSDLDDSKLP